MAAGDGTILGTITTSNGLTNAPDIGVNGYPVWAVGSNLYVMAYNSAGTVAAVTKSTDGGSTWTEVATQSLSAGGGSGTIRDVYVQEPDANDHWAIWIYSFYNSMSDNYVAYSSAVFDLATETWVASSPDFIDTAPPQSAPSRYPDRITGGRYHILAETSASVMGTGYWRASAAYWDATPALQTVLLGSGEADYNAGHALSSSIGSSSRMSTANGTVHYDATDTTIAATGSFWPGDSPTSEAGYRFTTSNFSGDARVLVGRFDETGGLQVDNASDYTEFDTFNIPTSGPARFADMALSIDRTEDIAYVFYESETDANDTVVFLSYDMADGTASGFGSPVVVSNATWLYSGSADPTNVVSHPINDAGRLICYYASFDDTNNDIEVSEIELVEGPKVGSISQTLPAFTQNATGSNLAGKVGGTATTTDSANHGQVLIPNSVVLRGDYGGFAYGTEPYSGSAAAAGGPTVVVGTAATTTETTATGLGLVVSVGIQATTTETPASGTVVVGVSVSGVQETTTESAFTGSVQAAVSGLSTTTTDLAAAGSTFIEITKAGAQATTTDTPQAGSNSVDAIAQGQQATLTDTPFAGQDFVEIPVIGAQTTTTATSAAGSVEVTETVFGVQSTTTEAPAIGSSFIEVSVSGASASTTETANAGGLGDQFISGAQATTTDTSATGQSVVDAILDGSQTTTTDTPSVGSEFLALIEEGAGATTTDTPATGQFAIDIIEEGVQSSTLETGLVGAIIQVYAGASSTITDTPAPGSIAAIVAGVFGTTTDTPIAGAVATSLPPNKPTIITPTGGTVAAPVDFEITYSDPDLDPQAAVAIRRLIPL